MSEIILTIWVWFPVYFILPLAIYFNYLIARHKEGLSETKSIFYALNPFRFFKIKSLNHKEKRISWLLALSIAFWVGVGFFIKSSLNLL